MLVGWIITVYEQWDKRGINNTDDSNGVQCRLTLGTMAELMRK